MMSTAEKSKTSPGKQKIDASEKEKMISDFFKKKAGEATKLLERNPVPEHLLKGVKKLL